MARPKGQAPKPEVLDKEAQVVALRREGMTWDTIAQAVGYKDPSGAHAAYMRASARIVKEDVDAIRDMETERLDMLQGAYWRQAMMGDVPAGMQVLRIMERRAKLLGIDQPIRQQVEVISYDADGIDSEVARLVRLLDNAESKQGTVDQSDNEPDSGENGEVAETPSEAEPTTT
jgi:hypothetical protein